ncbi:auxin-responsive protein IAA9-like isoform X2 [Phoenix dactylifera]|uniref:Auxin-responsive protein n=1 Tax=Phoenix dactylifera TaxID=42345 RepID=A0A8B8ZSQ7_PHODC|nr:auxin-responsive protein IAA9-like isoform X2 [Phoenix dactylifera]
MELELGLALPNNHLMKGLDLNDGSTTNSYRKRGFEEAFEEVIPKATLPLFVHKNGGDGDDENDSPQLKNSPELNSGNRALVGWPPVKHPRRRSAGGGAEERWSEHCGSNSDDGGGGRRAKCVKVKMEGVAIGRKVDLSLHDSYEELFHTLNQMFPNMQHELGIGGFAGFAHHPHHHRRRFMVTYEDGEGDWLLVGDMPWEDFIRSVKRLKILS